MAHETDDFFSDRVKVESVRECELNIDGIRARRPVIAMRRMPEKRHTFRRRRPAKAVAAFELKLAVQRRRPAA